MGKKCLRQRPLTSSSHCLPPAPGGTGGQRGSGTAPSQGTAGRARRGVTPAGTCSLRSGGAARAPPAPPVSRGAEGPWGQPCPRCVVGLSSALGPGLSCPPGCGQRASSEARLCQRRRHGRAGPEQGPPVPRPMALPPRAVWGSRAMGGILRLSLLPLAVQPGPRRVPPLRPRLRAPHLPLSFPITANYLVLSRAALSSSPGSPR